MAASLLFFLGFSIYNTVFINFVAEEIGINPSELGVLETVREVPGLLSVAIAAVTMWLVEPVLAFIALAIMAIGVINYLHVDAVWSLVLFSLIWSIGFHTWAPLSSSMALRMGPEGEEGRRLGLLRSVSNVGGLAGIAMVFIMVRFMSLPFRPMFVVAGIGILLAAFVLLRISRKDNIKPQKIVLRSQYWLFYVLQFLNGTRRHIFMTFAIFALVRVYETSLETVSVLSFVNQIVSVGASYAAGRLIDRHGERKVLAVGFAALTAIFLGYAFVEVVWILFALYVVDNAMFSMSVGIDTYGKKILVKPSDLRPTMVAGQTMNHIAAVIVPITGGLLWEAFGYVVPFVAGAAIAAISVGASLLITRSGDASTTAHESPRDRNEVVEVAEL
ncbi:MAG: MFS transporter [Pirellulaceae bacterium]|jgi:predicted MFS family arabinose efflux permease|nr:MFS transporter [Pirellulaceae bacterium]